MLGILRQLVEIPSISGTDAENEAIAAVAGIFADHGLDVDHWQIPLDEITTRPDFPGVEVDRQEAWGLVGRLTGRRSGTGDAPTLMFNGHVDVVPPGDLQHWTTDPFEGRLDGGRLFGRGSCDMKAGLVAALWATESIRRSGAQLRGDVLIAAVLGEEDGGLGTYSTLARGWTADACVIPEPTGLDLVPANAGALTFRLVVPGKAAHASRRTEGVSSIEKFWPVFEALERLEARRNRAPHPMAARWDIAYPLSIGTVHCGDWASSVPDGLIAEGRIGVAIDEPVAHARDELEHAVRAACDTDPWLRDHPATIEWWGGQFASGRLSDDSDLLDRARRCPRRRRRERSGGMDRSLRQRPAPDDRDRRGADAAVRPRRRGPRPRSRRVGRPRRGAHRGASTRRPRRRDVRSRLTPSPGAVGRRSMGRRRLGEQAQSMRQDVEHGTELLDAALR